MKKSNQSTIAGLNEVHLIGRITSIAGERKLPSGDIVSEFRIVVERKGKLGGVDTIDIAAWKSALRNKISKLKLESYIEVHGSVRRRFWQSAAGVASRWQVEASDIRRIDAK